MPLPRFVADELAQLATANVAADRLVFQSPEVLPVRATLFRRRFWAPAVDAAELSPLRIHDLRHTAVALWIADGANPKQIAVMAGHTSVSVVLDRYGHLYPEQDDELMDRLERRIARGPAERTFCAVFTDRVRVDRAAPAHQQDPRLWSA